MKYLLSFLLLSISLSSFAQYGKSRAEQEELTPEEAAYKEAERLTIRLNLEPYQTFYVDSILQSNIRGMKEEMDYLKKTMTTERTAFTQVTQKWLEKTEEAYKKVFTPEQMKEYLSSVGKLKKEKKKNRKKK